LQRILEAGIAVLFSSSSGSGDVGDIGDIGDIGGIGDIGDLSCSELVSVAGERRSWVAGRTC
jgi:hypothetical protein